jgi:hypothetical protein
LDYNKKKEWHLLLEYQDFGILYEYGLVPKKDRLMAPQVLYGMILEEAIE